MRSGFFDVTIKTFRDADRSLKADLALFLLPVITCFMNIIQSKAVRELSDITLFVLFS